MANGNNSDMKLALDQLNQWCRVNNISVQSVYDQCRGMTLQELVYYLIGYIKNVYEYIIDNKFDGVVSVKDYGAKGDGVTDDTVAFQMAINSGKNVLVPLSNGEKYRITRTITIPGQRQVIYGDLFITDWAYFDITASNGCIFFDASDSVLFKFTNVFNGATNISVYCDSGTNNVAFQFSKNCDITNVDAQISNCSIRNFNIGIDHHGRGLRVENNLFMSNAIAVQTEILLDKQFTIENPSDSVLFQTLPSYNGRSLFITGNRFHLISSRYLIVNSQNYQDDDNTVYQHLVGAIISNNMADLGRGGFEINAYMTGCIFTGNVFLRISPNIFFNCTVGAEKCVFSNNTIRGLIDTQYPQLNNYGIDCFAFANLTYSMIENNIIENFNGRCVYLYTTADFQHNVFTGNVFNNYGLNAELFQYQRCGFDISNSYYNVISNNTFYCTAVFNGYLIKCRDQTDNIWAHNVIMNNTYNQQNATIFLIPTSEGTTDNTIQTNTNQ